MSVLLNLVLPRTLATLVERFANAPHRGVRLEAWVFEDASSRAAAQRTLAAHGVAAVIRSAYKPLLHEFLDGFDRRDLTCMTIRLPDATTKPPRFQVEAYPLVPLLHPIPVRFEPGSSPDHYEVVLDRGAAGVVTIKVFAPNRQRPDHLGRPALSPTGWLRIWPAGATEPVHDAAMPSDYEAAFDAVIAAVRAHPWPAVPPLFEVLEIAIAIGGIERKLPWHDECLSTREALHEDLYFSLLELFQQMGGRPAGDRTFQPGQIAPFIRAASGPTTVQVALCAAAAQRPRSQEPERLDGASRPLTAAQLAGEQDALGGCGFAATSPQGRMIRGTYIAGSQPGLVVSSGQHANETSGPIGALRAGHILRRRPGAHLAVIAQENPDGYALHHRLRAENPRHMHHAARFTALGDDLEYRTREPFFEKSARLEAFRRTGARLHINLHGYPAHEWTRPLTGYLPTGYESYALPKGFFLIMRHHPGLAETADGFLRQLSARLITDPALARLNADQIAAYQAHFGDIGHPIHNGIVCMRGESRQQVPAFTLISEFPDETVYGDAFRLAHTTQMNTVLHAAELFLDHGALD